MADHQGVISSVDPVFCEIVGLRPGDLIGRHILDITHPADRDRNRMALDGLFDRHESFWIDKRYMRHDGSTVAVRNHVSIFPDEGEARLIAATEALIEREGPTKAERSHARDKLVFAALDRIAEVAGNRG